MKNAYIVLLAVLCSTVALAQKKDKIKGSKTVTVTQKEVERTAAPRLEVVLKEIELAAKNARTNSAMQKETFAEKVNLTSVALASNASADVKLPVIEIYRRPRVQVFRRHDGDFERE